MKKLLIKYSIICAIVVILISLLILAGRMARNSEVNQLKSEIEQLKEANNFKRELIHAYETYYDADGDSTSYDKWHVIDSLYRSQI